MSGAQGTYNGDGDPPPVPTWDGPPDYVFILFGDEFVVYNTDYLVES